MLNGLDLFSGIGGITLAIRDYATPVCYCEIDPYCQSVLLQRMSEGNLPKAPIWDDVRTLSSKELPRVDIIYGGFPCTDISVAKVGKGLDGQQSGLFFEFLRLIKEIHPAFVFFENVPAIRTRGLDRVLQELTKERYDCRWTMLSAKDLGFTHKRERWFMLAHTQSIGCEKERFSLRETTTFSRSSNSFKFENGYASQENKPDFFRMDDGLSRKLDKSRIKALGNSVVPLQTRKAFEILAFGYVST